MRKSIFLGVVLTVGILSVKAQSKSDTLKTVYYAQVNLANQNNIEAPQYSQPEYILDESAPSEKAKVTQPKKKLFSFKKRKNRSSSGRF